MFDIAINGLILILLFLKLVDNQSTKHIIYKSNEDLVKTKMFKVQPNIEMVELNNTIDIEMGESDINQICPICHEKADEYYIYHFFDNYPKEKEYKAGCLQKSHFICLSCSKHNDIDLTKCVMCRKKIND